MSRPGLHPETEDSNLKKVQNELQKRTQYIGSLQRNYECISNAFKKVTAELESVKKALDQAKRSSIIEEQNQQHNAQLERTIEALSNEKDALIKEVISIKDALTSSSLALQSTRDRLAQLSAQNHRLESELAKVSTSAQESRSLISEANQKVRENASLIDRKERIQLSMHAQIAKLHQTINEQEQRIHSLETDIQKAKNITYRYGKALVEIISALNRNSGIDRDNLKAEVTRMREQCSRLAGENQQNLQKMQSCNDANHDLKLQLKAVRARTDLEELHRTIEEIAASRQEAYERCDQLSNNVNELREQQEICQSKIVELRSSEMSKISKISELEQACSEHESNLIGLAHTKEELISCLETLQATRNERDELKRENGDLRQSIDDIESQRKIWMDDIRGLFGASTGQQELFREIEEINQRLHTSQEQIRQEIALVTKERDQLRIAAENTVKHNEKLELQLKSLHQHTAQIRKDFEKDSMQLRQELESTVTSLKEQLKDQRRELDHVRKRNKELLKQDRMHPSEVKAIRDRERELNATVSKLVLAEESSEPAYTCMDCMKPFTDPVTCVPCGHSACEQCIIRAGICIQCGDKRRVSYYPNQLLAELSAKHVYRRQALAGLLQMSQQFLAKQDKDNDA